MNDPLQDIRDSRRLAVDALAQDYLVRRRETETLDADAYFDDLRRQVEVRAQTLELVIENGPMGGGGPNEA